MSKVRAGVVVAAPRAITAPQSERQRGKALARAANALQRSLKGIGGDFPRHAALPDRARRGDGEQCSALSNRRAGTVRWIDERIAPTDTVWDVGAGIGLYALYMALNGTRVIAFEPSGLNFGLLVEHIALNRLGDRMVPCCVALDGTTQLSVLHFSQYDPGTSGNALGEARTQQRDQFEPVFSQGIPAMSGDRFLDVFATQAPDHLKVDVDGIEGEILRGSPNVLARVRSVLIETEGSNAARAETVIEPPLHEAGLREQTAWRELGSGRNRLFVRA